MKKSTSFFSGECYTPEAAVRITETAFKNYYNSNPGPDHGGLKNVCLIPKTSIFFQI
jgi:hypothetical protein